MSTSKKLKSEQFFVRVETVMHDFYMIIKEKRGHGKI